MNTRSLDFCAVTVFSVLVGVGCRGVIGENVGVDRTEGTEGIDGRVGSQTGESPESTDGAVDPGSTPTTSGTASSGGEPSPPIGPDGFRFTCRNPELRGRGQESMRRLTRGELLDSLRNIFGGSVMDADAVERATARIPLESPGDLVNTFQNDFALDHVEGILLTAEALAERVTQDSGAQREAFGACGAQADVECARTFLQTTGLRVLRRPLDADRTASLIEGFRAEGEGLAGMQWLLARIIQSPETVFHFELPKVACTDEVEVSPVQFSWDDDSVFFAPTGGEKTGPQERITDGGWYVWELPGSRVGEAVSEIIVELTASSQDDTAVEVSVNLNDTALIVPTALANGETTLRAEVSIPAGQATKVGVYFSNPGAGRAVAVRSLTLWSVGPGHECTEVASANGVFEVDSWSVASRVAFALTGMGPDAELLTAAAQGKLDTLEAVRSQAERLLANESRAARRQLAVMLDSWLDLNAIPTPNQVVANLAGVQPEGLAEEARQELIDFVTYLVFDDAADVRTLMTAQIGFPKTERLARLYGTDVASSGEPVALERGHGGLLLRIAPLLSGQLGSSPILRGVYVRKHVLCDTLPSPDFTIVNSRVAQFESVSHTDNSTREIVAQITGEGACPTCHQQINPIGFALEAFDPLGQPRAEEIVFDSDGMELARHPIDTTVTDANLEPGLPSTLNGAEDLKDALADSAKVRACIAERMYSQARLRARRPDDDCALAELERALREGASLREAWIDAVVNPELFVREAEEALP